MSTEVEAKEKTDIAEPPMYRCILHNDNYTTMEFVTEVLTTIFCKPVSEAQKIMLTVHNEGQAVVGIYPKDLAVTRVNKTVSAARMSGFPLKCTAEKI